MMYLLLSNNGGKRVFLDLEEALDYIIDGDFYVYKNPRLYKSNNNGVTFEDFLTFQDRLDFEGSEVKYEDRPKDTDHFTFHLHSQYPDMPSNNGWLWVDRFNEYKRFKKTVTDFGIALEDIECTK